MTPATPEQALTKFLEGWQAKQWSKMAEHTQKTWRHTTARAAEMLEGWFGFRELKSFQLQGVSYESPVCARVTAVIKYRFGDVVTKSITAMVIREKAPFRTDPEGDWGVNPSSALREHVEEDPKE